MGFISRVLFRGNLKFVIVVRQDLKMGTGKIAAQSAHAAVDAYAKLSETNKALLKTWKLCGQPKVVVKCQNEKELMELYKQTKAEGIPAVVIRDAGRTQLEAGCRSVLGVGPAAAEQIDKITGHLKLL